MPLKRLAFPYLCGLAVGSVLLTGCSLNPPPLRCEAEINRALAQASIPKAEVQSIREAREGSGRKQERNETLTGWVRLESCSGHVVVSMTRTCFVRQVYTTGDCQVVGIKRF